MQSVSLHVKMQWNAHAAQPESTLNNAVRISEDEMLELRQAAQLNRRSIAGQAEHWMRIGRAMERHPKVSYALVETALRSLEPATLDELDDGAHEDALMAMFTEPPSSQEQAFWQDRRQRGAGLGLDGADRLGFGGMEFLAMDEGAVGQARPARRGVHACM